MIALALQVGLLWFFIVFFTKETNTEVGMRSALIVVAVMLFVNITCGLLTATVAPFLAYLRLPIQVAVLYYAVSLVCGHPTRTTLKICGAYLISTILIAIATAILMTPV